MWAANSESTLVIEMLLARSADVTIVDNEGITALIWAIHTRNIEIVSLLLRNGCPINTQDKDGQTPLFTCAFDETKTECLELLLEKNPQIDLANKDGKTPLMAACAHGILEHVKMLVYCGASILSTDEDKSTPLIWACYMGHVDIVKFLLSNGANIEDKDRCDTTCLIWAASEGHEAVTSTLIDNKATLNNQNNHGLSAVMYAAYKGHTEVLELLLINKADTSLVAKNGHTLLACGKYAIKNKKDILQVLEKYSIQTKTSNLKQNNKGDGLEMPKKKLKSETSVASNVLAKARTSERRAGPAVAIASTQSRNTRATASRLSSFTSVPLMTSRATRTSILAGTPSPASTNAIRPRSSRKPPAMSVQCLPSRTPSDQTTSLTAASSTTSSEPTSTKESVPKLTFESSVTASTDMSTSSARTDNHISATVPEIIHPNATINPTVSNSVGLAAAAADPVSQSSSDTSSSTSASNSFAIREIPVDTTLSSNSHLPTSTSNITTQPFILTVPSRNRNIFTILSHRFETMASLLMSIPMTQEKRNEILTVFRENFVEITVIIELFVHYYVNLEKFLECTNQMCIPLGLAIQIFHKFKNELAVISTTF